MNYYILFLRSQELPYFDGVLQANLALQQVVKILPGELNGPESMQIDRDGTHIYIFSVSMFIVLISHGTHFILLK